LDFEPIERFKPTPKMTASAWSSTEGFARLVPREGHPFPFNPKQEIVE